MTKEKVLTVRFSPTDYELIQSAAREKLIPSSTLIRSLVITSIYNRFQPLQPPISPSPNLDKLSFEARKNLLSWLDFSVSHLLSQGMAFEQVENLLLNAASDGINSAKNEIKPLIRLNS